MTTINYNGDTEFKVGAKEIFNFLMNNYRGPISDSAYDAYYDSILYYLLTKEQNKTASILIEIIQDENIVYSEDVFNYVINDTINKLGETCTNLISDIAYRIGAVERDVFNAIMNEHEKYFRENEITKEYIQGLLNKHLSDYDIIYLYHNELNKGEEDI